MKEKRKRITDTVRRRCSREWHDKRRGFTAGCRGCGWPGS
ncbi:unnamed protein product [Phaeothamnion confervicola]